MVVGCIHLLVDMIKDWLRELPSFPLTNGILSANGNHPFSVFSNIGKRLPASFFPLARGPDVSYTLRRINEYTRILYILADCSMYWA